MNGPPSESMALRSVLVGMTQQTHLSNLFAEITPVEGTPLGEPPVRSPVKVERFRF